jgi:tetratricopeptide (TPR) repeat protein
MVSGKIADISAKLSLIANEHVQRGRALFEERKEDKALRSFLEALKLDPLNKVALDFLTKRYKATRFFNYTVQENDTFDSIAEINYGSSVYGFLVEHFSSVKKEKDLVVGSKIECALLDSFYSPALHDYQKEILIARKLFKAKDYEKVLPVAEQIRDKHPDDSEASFIINKSLLNLAQKLLDDENFNAAIAMLARVDPNFKNVKKQVETVRRLQKKRYAEYQLLSDEIVIEKGRALFAKGHYLDALDVYSQVDHQYPELDKAIAEVKEKIFVEAEKHFKEGIKFFVEEKLNKAINEWERTLAYNPHHVNAMRSIEKSQQLLEKLKEIK